MEKLLVEFVNTWPSCDGLERSARALCEEYGDAIDFHAWQVGRDAEVLKKYGFFMNGTLILDGQKFITRLSKRNMQKEIEAALRQKGLL